LARFPVRGVLLSFFLLIFAPPAQVVSGCNVPIGTIIARNFHALLCPKVQIDGIVRGDLIALGGEIIISAGGRIEGSILAVGASIHVNGGVGGSIRALSHELIITKTASLTGQNADVFAAALTFQSASKLPGDVWLAGRDARFLAPVNGKKYLALLPPDLPITPARRLADWIWGTVQGWFALVTLGLFALLNERERLDQVAGLIQADPVKAWWRGELLFLRVIAGIVPALLIAIGLVGVLAVASFGGLTVIAGVGVLALLIGIGGTLLLVTGVIAPLIAAVAVGRRYVRRLGDLPKGHAEFIGLLAGALVVAGLGNLPFIGIVFAQGFAAVGVGALWLYFQNLQNTRH
jgi:hypothetical protein